MQRINATRLHVMGFEFLSIIFLTLLYVNEISVTYRYAGFTIDEFSENRLLFTCIIVIFSITLGQIIRSRTYYLIYNIYLILFTIPGLILYVFSGADFYPNFLMGFPLGMFLFIDISGIHSRKLFHFKSMLRLKPKHILILSLLLLIPFFANINSINLRNLLLEEIYDTRLISRENKTLFIGYLSSPLSRFIFPFLIVYSYIIKNKKIFIFSLLSIVFVFLTSGALKSLLFQIPLTLYFSIKIFGKDLYEKTLRFYQLFSIGLGIELLILKLFDRPLFTDYIRRVFFVGPQLFDQYYNYFKDNFTYYKHTRFVSALTRNTEYRGITLWFGENVIGKDNLNASVGSFVEGFISIGTLGVILPSILMVWLCTYYDRQKLNDSYIGLLLTAVMLIHGAFLETLFVTHGLALFIIMMIYVLPKFSKNSLAKGEHSVR